MGKGPLERKLKFEKQNQELVKLPQCKLALAGSNRWQYLQDGINSLCFQMQEWRSAQFLTPLLHLHMRARVCLKLSTYLATPHS